MQPYFYNAECIGVTDGDTCTVKIDVGFGFTTVQKLRFIGINTPERHVEGYEEATQFTKDKILNKKIIINTVEKDAFGRWLASVYYKEEDTYKSLNEELLSTGLAVVYKR
ncbi:thermonuclease family protein [Priestia endophytica]